MISRLWLLLLLVDSLKKSSPTSSISSSSTSFTTSPLQFTTQSFLHHVLGGPFLLSSSWWSSTLFLLILSCLYARFPGYFCISSAHAASRISTCLFGKTQNELTWLTSSPTPLAPLLHSFKHWESNLERRKSLPIYRTSLTRGCSTWQMSRGWCMCPCKR